MKNDDRFIYRLTYTKGDNVKYISHLDFLRCVNRCFKRAKIDVKYSQGFNPHILLNIALPCAVGVKSECEMLDIELNTPIDETRLMDKLNLSMVEGVRFIKCERNLDLKEFSKINTALYEITFTSSKTLDISSFTPAKEVMIEKKSKRANNFVNIWDFVKDFHLTALDENSYKINCILNAGSVSNLKPELLVGAMKIYYECEFSDIKTTRREIYFED